MDQASLLHHKPPGLRFEQSCDGEQRDQNAATLPHPQTHSVMQMAEQACWEGGLRTTKVVSNGANQCHPTGEGVLDFLGPHSPGPGPSSHANMCPKFELHPVADIRNKSGERSTHPLPVVRQKGLAREKCFGTCLNGIINMCLRAHQQDCFYPLG